MGDLLVAPPWCMLISGSRPYTMIMDYGHIQNEHDPMIMAIYLRARKFDCFIGTHKLQPLYVR